MTSRHSLAERLHQVMCELLELTQKQLAALDQSDHEALLKLTDRKGELLNRMSELRQKLKACEPKRVSGSAPVSDEDYMLNRSSSMLMRLLAMDKYLQRQTLWNQQLIGSKLARLVAGRSAVSRYSGLANVGRRIDSST